MIILNTTGKIVITDKDSPEYGKEFMTLDRNYSYGESKIVPNGLRPAADYGFTDHWFGGNVQLVAKLMDSPVFLLISTIGGYKVYNTGLDLKDAEKYLMSLELKTLKMLAKVNGVHYQQKDDKNVIVENFISAKTSR